MTACRPFQIDASFGFGAAVLETLVQSDGRFIHILPALAEDWVNGCSSGLYLPGGVKIDLQWENDGAVELNLYSRTECHRHVKHGPIYQSVLLFVGKPITLVF